MSSPLVVETSGHDQVDFQRTSSHFGNELLKEADSSDLNGKLFLTSCFKIKLALNYAFDLFFQKRILKNFGN